MLLQKYERSISGRSILSVVVLNPQTGSYAHYFHDPLVERPHIVNTARGNESVTVSFSDLMRIYESVPFSMYPVSEVHPGAFEAALARYRHYATLHFPQEKRARALLIRKAHQASAHLEQLLWRITHS